MKAIQKAILGAMISIVVLWGSSAMADSLYKQNNFSLGVGYTSVAFNFPSPFTSLNYSVNGVSLQGMYFFTDNVDLAIQAAFLSGTTTVATSTSVTPIIFQLGYHGDIMANFGYYGEIGYHTTSASSGGSSISTNGFEFEVGLESKFADQFSGNVGYKYTNMSAATGATLVIPDGTTASGVTVHLNYIF